MKYAKDTDVAVDKSKTEIEKTVQRYGATGFVSGWRESQAMISFEMHDRRVRIMLPLPDRNEKRFTYRNQVASNQYGPAGEHRETPERAAAKWEQACRQKWRALVLIVKAKLEAVDAGVSTFEEEFMPYMVLPTGLTIAETLLPQLPQIASTGKMPPLLPGPKPQ